MIKYMYMLITFFKFKNYYYYYFFADNIIAYYYTIKGHLCILKRIHFLDCLLTT